MVNIIEDWDVLAEYVGEKLGFYLGQGKILKNGGLKVREDLQQGSVPLKDTHARLTYNQTVRRQSQRKSKRLVPIINSAIVSLQRILWVIINNVQAQSVL